MELSAAQLKEVYNGILLPLGHPDPFGYIARALYVSGGDDEYYDIDGKQGFMPVLPERAAQMTGNVNVYALADNVSTTAIMDRMFFEQYGSIDDMIVAFHFGEDAVIVGDDIYSGTIKRFLDVINESRPEVRSIVIPPRATLADVIGMLSKQLAGRNKAGRNVVNVIKGILEQN